MKAIIALTILIAVASASMVSQRDIDTMMESNWGKIFLNMAQL
jgi:Flp pilus assembly protein protease CpaA